MPPQREELSLKPPKHLLDIFDAPAEQTLSERILIYGLVMGLRPQRCLEIGTHFGGSAVVIAAALDDIGRGKLHCLDPNPLIDEMTFQKIGHRAKIIRGNSPDDLIDVRNQAGGHFDFVLIDGDHSYEGVSSDIDGMMNVVGNGTCILFHDARNDEIRHAIDDSLVRFSDRLIDWGLIDVQGVDETRENNIINWGGIRVLRVA